MFKKMQLIFHLFILYGFLGVFFLIVSLFAIFTIRDYENTLLEVDREQLPLSRSIAEISRNQLNQALRLSEILLFARIGDREKFEISNETYMQAGKQIADDILEGRNIAQKGIDMANSSNKLKQLDALKTILKEIEKTHGDFEHLGSTLIRGIYQHEFLSTKDYLTSGDHMAAEEEASKHITFLKTTLSAIEDETERLESTIRQASELIKQLSQTLAIDAKHTKNKTFKIMIPLLFFTLGGGLILVLIIEKIQANREKNKNQMTGHALTLLTHSLNHLNTNFQSLESTSNQLENNYSIQKEAFGNSIVNMKQLHALSDHTVQLTNQVHSLVVEKNRALEHTHILVSQLNKDAGKTLESGVETGRIVRNLKETVMQINLLATNASAEATRSEATKGFVIFSEEIKNLARLATNITENVSERTDNAIKKIHTDHEQISNTHQKFTEVVDLAKKLIELFEKMATSTEKQSSLIQDLTSATSGVNEAMMGNEPLLEQTKALRNEVGSEVKSAHESVMGWPG